MGIHHQSRNVKVIVIWSVVGILAIVLIVSWSQSIFGKAPSALKTELEAAAKDGMPVEPGDMRRQINVPKDKNAAPMLTAAYAGLKEWDAGKDGKEFAKNLNVLKSDKALTPSQFMEVRQEVASASNILAQLNEAVKFPLIDFNRQWEKGPALMLPEYAYAKQGCSLFLAQARTKFADGKNAVGLDSMDSAARLAALAGQEPIIISFLVQCSMQTLVLRDLADVIKSHSTDEAILERCRLIANDLGPPPEIRRAIGFELVNGRLGVAMLAHHSGDQVFGDSANKITTIARFGPARSVYELRYVQTMHKLYKDLGQNPRSYLAMQKVFQSLDEKLSGNQDWSYGLTELMSPMFSGLARALGEAQARRNVTLCAIDLLESKLRGGKIPLALGGSEGQWLDPFTERPLLYRPSTAGFLIYSVGPDGKDNGGKPRSKEMSDTGYDIPFNFP